MSSMIF